MKTVALFTAYTGLQKSESLSSDEMFVLVSLKFYFLTFFEKIQKSKKFKKIKCCVFRLFLSVFLGERTSSFQTNILMDILVYLTEKCNRLQIYDLLRLTEIIILFLDRE